MEICVDNIEEGVTLYPSHDEFLNFREYVNSLEQMPELQSHGIVKVNIIRLSLHHHSSDKSETSPLIKSTKSQSSNLSNKKYTETKVPITRSIRTHAHAKKNNLQSRIQKTINKRAKSNKKSFRATNRKILLEEFASSISNIRM